MDASKRERCVKNRSSLPRGIGKGYIDGALSPAGHRLWVAPLLVELDGGEVGMVDVLARRNAVLGAGQHPRTRAG